MAATRVGETVASIPKGPSLVAALVVFLPKDVLKGPGGFLNLLGGCLPELTIRLLCIFREILAEAAFCPTASAE